jgi:prepilin-type N-terminal cleavage/methylation domain-containing protein
MQSSPSQKAFTLIEMVTVIAVITILSGLVLSVSSLVQVKGAKAKTQGEIRALQTACDSYKTDNGGYPQDIPSTTGGPSATNTLDPRVHGNPTSTGTPSYSASSLFLYKALTGDDNANGKIDTAGANPETGRNYATDFFRPSRFNSSFKTTGIVTAIVDSFGSSYGYSTAGLKAEQDFRTELQTNPGASRTVASGYNPTFDLWSTCGTTTGSDADRAKWEKNW